VGCCSGTGRAHWQRHAPSAPTTPGHPRFHALPSTVQFKCHFRFRLSAIKVNGCSPRRGTAIIILKSRGPPQPIGKPAFGVPHTLGLSDRPGAFPCGSEDTLARKPEDALLGFGLSLSVLRSPF
jgi:hypothetical protein